MPPLLNPRLLFQQIPTGLPDAQTVFKYDTSATIDIDSMDLLGGLIVKVLALSLDPYMRNRMRPTDTEGDMPAFGLGEACVATFNVICPSET